MKQDPGNLAGPQAVNKVEPVTKAATVAAPVTALIIDRQATATAEAGLLSTTIVKTVIFTIRKPVATAAGLAEKAKGATAAVRVAGQARAGVPTKFTLALLFTVII